MTVLSVMGSYGSHFLCVWSECSISPCLHLCLCRFICSVLFCSACIWCSCLYPCSSSSQPFLVLTLWIFYILSTVLFLGLPQILPLFFEFLLCLAWWISYCFRLDSLFLPTHLFVSCIWVLSVVLRSMYLGMAAARKKSRLSSNQKVPGSNTGSHACQSVLEQDTETPNCPVWAVACIVTLNGSLCHRLLNGWIWQVL